MTFLSCHLGDYQWVEWVEGGLLLLSSLYEILVGSGKGYACLSVAPLVEDTTAECVGVVRQGGEVTSLKLHFKAKQEFKAFILYICYNFNLYFLQVKHCNV